MDQKHHINIAGFKIIEYRSKRTGLPEQMKLAQCVVTSQDEEKGEVIVVGELVLPKSMHDATAGQYLAEFELSVGMDLRIGARLTKLHPVAPVALVPPVPPVPPPPAARPTAAQSSAKSGAPA